MNILSKLVLGGLLVLAGLAVWLLPKSRLVTGRISERLFVVTFVVGALCSAAGLAALFVLPGRVRQWHLWELAVMPLVVVYAYWIAVMRKARTSEIVDEKQNFDMTNASGLAWALSLPAMMVAFVLYEAGLFDPALWFPFYLLVTLLLHSTATLYFFKRR
ncbi:MAG: hypothetical protein AAB225_11990 [Acidobacteriota bacterium]